MLGLICHELGRHAEALTLIGAALKVKASSPDAICGRTTQRCCARIRASSISPRS